MANGRKLVAKPLNGSEIGDKVVLINPLIPFSCILFLLSRKLVCDLYHLKVNLRLVFTKGLLIIQMVHSVVYILNLLDFRVRFDVVVCVFSIRASARLFLPTHIIGLFSNPRPWLVPCALIPDKGCHSMSCLHVFSQLCASLVVGLETALGLVSVDVQVVPLVHNVTTFKFKVRKHCLSFICCL